MDAPQTGEFAHIGKSVVIKGELSGSEDLYVDGNVEGKVEMRNHSLTVGPNGNVKAEVTAKSVVIQGKLDGSIVASERVELRKSAVVNGDVTTQRIAIERRDPGQTVTKFTRRQCAGDWLLICCHGLTPSA